MAERGTLDRLDGELVWSKHLVEELGAEQPNYGFATSPILMDGKMIVHAEIKIGDSMIMLVDEMPQMERCVSPQQLGGTAAPVQFPPRHP